MAFHPDGTPSEQADELVDREPGLTEDRSQSSPCQFPVERQNDHPTVSASQLHVAAPLADLLEATPCERLDGIPLAMELVTTGNAGLTQRGARWR